MVKIVGDASEKGYQYKIIRLTKTILGTKCANPYETVLLDESAMENLLGPFYNGIVNSIYTIFRQRSVFSLNEKAIDMKKTINSLVPRVAEFLYPKGEVFVRSCRHAAAAQLCKKEKTVRFQP